LLAGGDVLVVGYFSAKQKDYSLVMEEVAGLAADHGACVVGRFVQRRGVSDGGVARMSHPFSSRTLFRAGKIREIAVAREETGAVGVVFVNALTEHQRAALEEIFGCPVFCSAELRA
jgi:50S ribosomal subunit-associated GTPase HflX